MNCCLQSAQLSSCTFFCSQERGPLRRRLCLIASSHTDGGDLPKEVPVGCRTPHLIYHGSFKQVDGVIFSKLLSDATQSSLKIHTAWDSYSASSRVLSQACQAVFPDRCCHTPSCRQKSAELSRGVPFTLAAVCCNVHDVVKAIRIDSAFACLSFTFSTQVFQKLQKYAMPVNMR